MDIDSMEILHAIDKDLMERSAKFLSLFFDATKDVEKSKAPTLYSVQPWTRLITAHLEPQLDDCEVTEAMKAKGINYMEQNFVQTKYHQASIILHPLLKTLNSVPENEIDRLKYQVSCNLSFPVNLYMPKPSEPTCRSALI